MSHDVSHLLERETQLSMLAYLTILALLTLSGVLLYMLVAQIAIPASWILGDMWVRAIGLALIFAVVVHLADQERRLQSEFSHSYSELSAARDEISLAYERLAFSQHIAEVLASEPDEAIPEALDDIAGNFDAHAAAIVGQEVTLFVHDERYRDDASAAIVQTALDTMRAGTTLSVTTSDDGSTALGLPLRVNGRLHSVLCLWRRKAKLPLRAIDGLQTVGRVFELSIENRLDETGGRLSGMIHALLGLLERRSPAYTAHAELVARLSDQIAERLGIDADSRHSLRLSALLHDIGLLEVPERILASSPDLNFDDRATVERHPQFGAELAEAAGLTAEVANAIRGHHERLDGSGFPFGSGGTSIPLLSRILAVADDFAAMTTPEVPQAVLEQPQALHILRLGAGTQYDLRVFAALELTLEHGSEPNEVTAPLRPATFLPGE